ncbi:ABC transporter ATP-binding protein [Aquabacterium sp. OR-4]|uniref:ABC transporter ATP-binding protein n=1 Tax=Aquabacterium sp. OR-4 TaxID=2978127 RepID=UPI0021B17A3D|nr:ABC transporter ATP-binding protein [Aquabacterium sp. OR-4]MDT7836149.1 ABC transporter ATP-binding protein [Aquabacterium sp. OR-4]
MTVVLRTDGLVKRFGGITATNKVSLSITRGARHALIGPNGAGKTTLINQLTGVMPPTEGRVWLGQRDITHLAPHKRVGLGLVRTFQISQLFGELTPLQSLALAVSSREGQAHRWWRPLGRNAAVAAECEALLAQFRLAEHAGRLTRELPYGKRRLLEIALAVAQKPSVLLLDEPAAGVPAAERQDILDTVAALPADVSVVLIEHDMDLVFSFASRLTVLVNGTVLTEGTPAEIAADPQVRAVYLGDSMAGVRDGH